VIDLGDDMQFKVLPAGASADTLVCSDPTIPHDDSNLVIKVGLQGPTKCYFYQQALGVGVGWGVGGYWWGGGVSREPSIEACARVGGAVCRAQLRQPASVGLELLAAAAATVSSRRR